MHAAHRFTLSVPDQTHNNHVLVQQSLDWEKFIIAISRRLYILFNLVLFYLLFFRPPFLLLSLF